MNYPTIQNHDRLKETVNARDLHKFLEIGKDFTNWMKDQIKRARLVEYADYIKVAEKGELSKTGQTLTEYHITIESAKHIGMMSQSDKGFEVRDYFIDCEKKAQVAQAALPQDYSQALRMLADEVESKKVLAMENEQQRHTIQAKDKYIVVSNEASIKAGEIKVSEFCKSHDFIDIGQNKMYTWLRDKGFLFQGSREPIQKYVNLGWFTWKPSQEKHGGKFRSCLRITPRGKVKLASLYMDSMEQGGFA
ncbi:MAG: antA/AntB antirepressor family protein [Mariprofundaceae bacterium]|nr:antA/AntB antirepressor family protein [Mariprofundaceae bacterium]